MTTSLRGRTEKVASFWKRSRSSQISLGPRNPKAVSLLVENWAYGIVDTVRRRSRLSGLSGLRDKIDLQVNDFMVIGGDGFTMERVKEKLKVRFEMKNLGEAENILGIRIRRYEGKLIVDQAQFGRETVAQFLYDDSMKHVTPMEPEAVRKLTDGLGRSLSQVEGLKYVELLGKLIWRHPIVGNNVDRGKGILQCALYELLFVIITSLQVFFNPVAGPRKNVIGSRTKTADEVTKSRMSDMSKGEAAGYRVAAA